MAKRQIDYTVCSNCIETFDRRDMYVIERWMHRGHPEKGIYRTSYCEQCTIETKGTIWNLGIIEEPKSKQVKVPKKRETKKKP